MAAGWLGLDFGTSNSSAAYAQSGDVSIIPLDSANDSPYSLPSLLYIPREGHALVGRRAADAFIANNVGREVVLKQVDLGVDIEGYVASEPDKSEAYIPRPDDEDSREAVRAHALVEMNSPGRLFQSIKSSLRHRGFTGTDVFGQHYQIEELVAMILEPMRAAAEKQTGRSIKSAVFGRPVIFSSNAEENDLAEERLRRAAALAGFEHIELFYEPVAACVEYAVQVDQTSRLMVVDIGGGTCDACLMEFSGAHGAAQRLAESKILAVGGIPTAGDAMDRELLRAKVFPSLGSRARYGPGKLPMPQYLYRSIADWQTLYRHNTEETLNWLIAAEGNSTDPQAIRALRTLIRMNYGYPLVRRAEAAKKELSEDDAARISMCEDPDMHIDVAISRHEFDAIINHLIEDIMDSLIETEQRAGIDPSQLDLVLTTGGTSLIPALRGRLAERYGASKLLQRETFTSVARGLAVVAEMAGSA